MAQLFEAQQQCFKITLPSFISLFGLSICLLHMMITLFGIIPEVYILEAFNEIKACLTYPIKKGSCFQTHKGKTFHRNLYWVMSCK